MLYFKRDLICDYLYSYGIKYEQNVEDKELKFKYISTVENIDEYFEKLFYLFKIIRIGKSNETPYKIHKSFPSARSFYIQELYISIGENLYLTLNSKTGKFEKYENTEIGTCKKGTLFIISKKIPVDYYNSIKKSLNLLEIGHILFNISILCDIFNKEIESIETNNKYIQINIASIEKSRFDLSFNNFQLYCKERTSGPYLKKITNFQKDFNKGVYIPKIKDNDEFAILNKSIPYVKRLILRNNGKDGFDEKNLNISLSYEELNSEYNYIDFRYASQYTLFLLEKSIPSEFLTNNILLIGYLAQEICLFNSRKNLYNRPVKQVVSPNLWNSKFRDLSDKYIPFYAVLSGFYDI